MQIKCNLLILQTVLDPKIHRRRLIDDSKASKQELIKLLALMGNSVCSGSTCRVFKNNTVIKSQLKAGLLSLDFNQLSS